MHPLVIFADLNNINHHAQRLLHQYKHRCAPIILKTTPWTKDNMDKAIKREPHKSCINHIEFLEEKFMDMLNKGQWVVVLYDLAATLPNLCISPPGAVPQHGR